MKNFFRENSLFLVSVALLAGLVAGAARPENTPDAHGPALAPEEMPTADAAGGAAIAPHDPSSATATTPAASPDAPAATPQLQAASATAPNGSIRPSIPGVEDGDDAGTEGRYDNDDD